MFTTTKLRISIKGKRYTATIISYAEPEPRFGQYFIHNGVTVAGRNETIKTSNRCNEQEFRALIRANDYLCQRKYY